MKKAPYAAAAVIIVCLLSASIPGLADFPFNGGFEQVDKGQPVGWEVAGVWMTPSQRAYAGRRYALLPGTVARAGDRLVSQGYRLVAPGGALKLSVAYHCSPGGAVIGLVYCDALGQPLFDGFISSLPPTNEWEVVEDEITLPTDSLPPEVRAVRVFVGVEETGAEAHFDAVLLTAGDQPLRRGLSGQVPEIEALSRPNLLRNPDLKTGPTGGLVGWSAVDSPGFAPECAEAVAGSSGQGGRLVLRESDQKVAWISDSVPVNTGLPYQATCRLEGVEADAGRFSLLVRTLDPSDPAAVWRQATASATGSYQAQELAVRLPRLWREPKRGLVQVALVWEAGSADAVSVSAIALRPEPVSLSVRPVAVAGDFLRADQVQLFISALNNTDQDLEPMAYMKVFDADGEVAYYEPRRVKISANSAGYFPLNPKLDSPGEYQLLIRLMQEGQDLGSTTFDFRVGGG